MDDLIFEGFIKPYLSITCFFNHIFIFLPACFIVFFPAGFCYFRFASHIIWPVLCAFYHPRWFHQKGVLWLGSIAERWGGNFELRFHIWVDCPLPGFQWQVKVYSLYRSPTQNMQQKKPCGDEPSTHPTDSVGGSFRPGRRSIPHSWVGFGDVGLQHPSYIVGSLFK